MIPTVVVIIHLCPEGLSLINKESLPFGCRVIVLLNIPIGALKLRLRNVERMMARSRLVFLSPDVSNLREAHRSTLLDFDRMMSELQARQAGKFSLQTGSSTVMKQ